MFLYQHSNLNYYLYFEDVKDNKRKKVSLKTSDIKKAKKLLNRYQTFPQLIYDELMKLPKHLENRNDLLIGNIQKDESLFKYLNQYLKHTELNHTAKTQKVIRQTIKFFCAYLTNVDFKTLKTKTVLELMQGVKGINIHSVDKVKLDTYLQKRLKENSLYQARVDRINLSGFFSYLVNQNVLTENPISKTKLPKLPEKLPLWIKQDEFETIIQHTELDIMRDVFNVAYFTGMRVTEIISLRFSMIDFDERLIKLDNQTNLTKSKRFRVIPTNQIVYNTLIKLRDSATTDNVFELLPSNNTRDYIGKYFKKVIRKIGLNNKLHFHSIRHSFATNLAVKGVPVTVIQKLMGHANVTTTMIYTHTSNTQLKDAINLL